MIHCTLQIVVAAALRIYETCVHVSCTSYHWITDCQRRVTGSGAALRCNMIFIDLIHWLQLHSSSYSTSQQLVLVKRLFNACHSSCSKNQSHQWQYNFEEREVIRSAHVFWIFIIFAMPMQSVMLVQARLYLFAEPTQCNVCTLDSFLGMSGWRQCTQSIRGTNERDRARAFMVGWAIKRLLSRIALLKHNHAQVFTTGIVLSGEQRRDREGEFQLSPD